MNAHTLRRSLVGAGIGGGLFGLISLYRSWVSPGSLLDYLGPMGIMAVIGATVGGLVGPLVGRIIARRRQEKEADAASVGSPGESESKGSTEEPETGSPPQQPLVLTLLVGLGVGYGVGTAWGQVWAGLGLGLVLALLARRIFR